MPCPRPTQIFVSLAIAFVLIAKLPAQDWPQWQGEHRDGTWNETGILESFPAEGPKLLWKAEIAGGYAGPAVAEGRVFVTDYLREAGDATPNPGKRSELQGLERVNCLDAQTGELLWRHSYPCQYNFSYAAGPRATPTINEGRVYHLGAEGRLVCLKAESGDLVWQRDLKQDYDVEMAPMWGYAAHTLVDGDALFCLAGGQGSTVVALDKRTGAEKWRALSADEIGYCPPTMIEAGGVKQLLIWHPESLNSLNPESGEVYWSFNMEPAYKMSIIAPVKHGDYLFATALQGTSILIKLGSDAPTAEEVWRGKGPHPDHNPPLLVDGHIYGVDEQGQLRCFELQTGEKIWESWAVATNNRPANSTTGFLVKNNDQYFIATEQGELVLAALSTGGYRETGRFRMLEPTSQTGNRDVVWSHPAFANRCVFARNDKEIVCYSLAK